MENLRQRGVIGRQRVSRMRAELADVGLTVMDPFRRVKQIQPDLPLEQLIFIMNQPEGGLMHLRYRRRNRLIRQDAQPMECHPVKTERSIQIFIRTNRWVLHYSIQCGGDRH